MKLGIYKIGYARMTVVVTFIISFWQSNTIWSILSIVSFILDITKVKVRLETADRRCAYEN